MRKTTLISIFIFLACNTSWAIKRYVTPTGAGTFSGLSWANAAADLQTTINNSGVSDQIFMKTGTYYPSSFPSGCTGCGAPSANNRNNTFSLKSDLRITGGFSGWESEEWQRNTIANKTILSGNLGLPLVFTDNAYHVVTNINNLNVYLLDLTIQLGNADGTSSIDVGGQTLYQVWGGGSLNINSRINYFNCLFVNNRAESGGAILNSASSISSMYYSVVLENTAGGAGAVYCHNNSTAYIINSTVVNNSATAAGGAFYIFGGSGLNIHNSIVWGNTSPSFPAIALNSGTSTSSNSIVQGGTSPCNTCPNTDGNINPLFLNINNPRGNDGVLGTYDDGLNLKLLSPAVNTGGSTSFVYDILHRYSDGGEDIGAYEYMASGNCISTNGAIPGKYVGESPIASGQYVSSNLMISDAPILIGNSVLFKAEKSIELKPGFVASSNSIFEAKIIGSCAALTAFKNNGGLH
jgi:hypothetical protein